MQDRYDRIQEEIGYRFKDISLLDQAFRHRSMGRLNNERLEFLGDAVLAYLITEHIYRESEEADEAYLTRTRSLLTDRTTLRTVGERLDLEELIQIDPSMRGKASQKMLADTVEALIGAVYLDGGLEATKKVVQRAILRPEVKEAALARQDWISLIKEYCDRERLQYKYQTIEVDMDKDKAFQAWLSLGNHTENGVGTTKKEAMAVAARKMVSYLASKMKN